MTSAAHAGGFSTARFGGEAAHAASDHVTAIYYNPAGLAHGHGTRALVEGLFAYRSVDYTRPEAAIDNVGTGTPSSDVAANSGKATLRNGIVSPFIGIATDGGIEGLGVGVGVYVPFGGQAKWDQNDAYAGNTMYPGAVDGPQRWAAIEGSQRSLYYTLAAGWRTRTGTFAVGAGLNVVQNSVDLVRARNVDGSDNLVAGAVVVEGRSLVEGKATNLGASIGVMVKPTPCSRIGLSYQSQPGFGEQSLSGTLTNKFGAGPETESDIEVRQELPDVIRLAGEWRAFTKAALHAQVDYQRWSVYENTCIMNAGTTGQCEVAANGSTTEDGIIVNVPRNWVDTYSVRVGGRYFASDALELNGGLTYDSSAVPDSRDGQEQYGSTMDPSLFDMNKVVGQAGAAWTNGRLGLSLTLAHVYYFERTVAARAEDPLSPSRNPDMAGTYASSVTYALVGVGVRM